MIFAPPGATFQINVRSLQSIVSGMSGISSDLAHVQSFFECLCHRVGSSPIVFSGCPSVPRKDLAAFARGPCDLIDVHAMEFVLRQPKIDRNRPKSRSWSRSQDFLCFESKKPLQTFSTSTALRMSNETLCVCFGPSSRRNTRKTTKMEQKLLLGRPQPLQGWF